ncbi:unnamed protein product [Protopolystoma xenopodis]|uniref:Ionotropic glutamate receptor C-terminal domain-containing protein n=1 Tax=Protopolystoma xenopodis TaxID=117903 RepID=A0A3S5BX64_9PLAT|nr:unnamed protein product [Protopolystoma xenopodis]
MLANFFGLMLAMVYSANLVSMRLTSSNNIAPEFNSPEDLLALHNNLRFV